MNEEAEGREGRQRKIIKRLIILLEGNPMTEITYRTWYSGQAFALPPDGFASWFDLALAQDAREPGRSAFAGLACIIRRNGIAVAIDHLINDTGWRGGQERKKKCGMPGMPIPVWFAM